MIRCYYIFFIVLWIVFSRFLPAAAQIIIHGHIQDAETNLPLPAANIQIEGTFQGTITNADGNFVLTLDQLPATIHVSYIGYQSQEISIRRQVPSDLRISLKPIILDMDAIVVVAEDPALAIMREVIRRKQLWRKDLLTYRAKAYSRLVFENDSGIVSIAESLSDFFWDHEKGTREVITSKRQTNNLSDQQNMAVASFIPNFYDDDIDIIGFKVIGPTHPDALDYYDFKLLRERKLDDQTVFEIQVIPDSKLQPTFEGKLSVLDKEFALLDVELKPSATIRFPMPIQELNLYYSQQFNHYKKEFWLPVDFRVDGDIKIGLTGLQFPRIIYKRITALSAYQINVDLPDSLYQSENVLTVDSLALQQDSLFATTRISIPLTQNEETAYATLDSTMTLEKAFKPSGFLADLIEVTSDDERSENDGGSDLFSWLNPQLWYNRVDALHIGLAFSPRLMQNLEVKFGGGYKTGAKKWSALLELLYHFGADRHWYASIAYEAGTQPRYPSETWSLFLASFQPVFAQPDYYDYYWQEDLRFMLGYRISALRTTVSVGASSAFQTSMDKTSDFNVLGTGYEQRENPPVQSGIMHSLHLRIKYGDDLIPYGVIGQKRLLLQIERSSPSLLQSDFDFNKYMISFDWRFNTFLRRRLLPNTLDIHVDGGSSTGHLPVQRWGAVDGSFSFFTPYPVLRSRRSRPFEGEQYFCFSWEHNFRTVPFELINFDFLIDHNIGIIIFGSHGRSWISDQSLAELEFDPAYSGKWHNESGVSLTNLFGFLRFDTVYRWETGGVYTGLSLTRFF